MINKEKINTDDFWDNWNYPKSFTGKDIEEVDKAIKITIKKSLSLQKEKILKVIDKFWDYPLDENQQYLECSVDEWEELKQKIKRRK